MANNDAQGVLSVGYDDSGVDKGIKGTADNTEKQTKRMRRSTKELADGATKDFDRTGDAAIAAANKVEAARKKTESSMEKAKAYERKRAADLENKQEVTKQVKTKAEADLETARLRSRNVTLVEEGRRRRTILRYQGQMEVDERRLQLKSLDKVNTEERRALRDDIRQRDAIMKRAILAGPGVERDIAAAIGGDLNLRRRSTMAGFGLTQTQAFAEQISSATGFGDAERNWLIGASRVQPPSLGGKDRQLLELQRLATKEEKAAEREIERIQEEGRRKDKQRQRERTAAANAQKADFERQLKQIDRIMNRLGQAPATVQAQVRNLLMSPQAFQARAGMRAAGATWNQAFQGNLAPSFGQQNAQWMTGGRGPTPPIFGGGAAAGGGGWMGRLGRFGSSFASGLGIGVGGMGAYALAQGAAALVEDTKRATAYERQSVAAEKLAGSQAKLNELLDAYGEASGNAVDKVTTLSNVTRLMATGFANDADEVERFVRATRGASIALGKPQDYVIQETQLAISNTSVKRLDQIGLGIGEVNDRIEQLRDANADWTREMAFQDAVLSLMTDKYAHLTETAEGQATGVERLARAWADLRLEMGKSASGPVNAASSGVAGFLEGFTLQSQYERELREDPKFRPRLGATDQERRAFESAQGSVNTENALKKAMEDLTRAILKGQGMNYDAIQAAQGPQFRDRVPSWMTSSATALMPVPAAPLSQYDKQEGAADIMRAAFTAEQDIIRNAYKQRNDAIAQYEEQRTNLVANYAKQRVREEEDFARQRARALRDYERSVMDVLRDSREREAEMQEDLDERIADLNEDSNERITDLQDKYNKDREKAEEQHRDRLMKAAGQLDAIAVLEERKRFAEENKEREEAHREAIDEQRENLAEQIEEAREAHAEQLEDARKADEKRLEDMRIARDRQIADENEDRRLRLERQQEDHEDQLAEMDRQHGLNLERIEQEAKEQREALADALEKDLAEVGVYIAGYHKKMEERDRLVEEWVEEMIARMEMEIAQDALNDERSATSRYRFDPKLGPMIPTDYGAGILNTSNLSYGGITNSKVVTIQAGAIQVTAQPGMEIYVAGLVEERLIELMEDY